MYIPELTKETILDLYIKLIEKAKNEFCKPSEFLVKFKYQKEIVTLNLMNFCLVNTNQIRPRYLWVILHEIFDEYILKEYYKDYREYSSFSFFLKKHSIDRFKKSDKPDFYIQFNNTIYDLEVTSVSLENDMILDKIGLTLFGQSKTELECRNYVLKKHKKLDWNKYYRNYNGINIISRPIQNCNDYFQLIVNSIIKKNSKVIKFDDNNKKWLLLDTESNICFSTTHDIDKLQLKLSEIKNEIENIDSIFLINRQKNMFFKYNKKET